MVQISVQDKTKESKVRVMKWRVTSDEYLPRASGHY